MDIAFLPGHDLRFNKRGQDGTGKANAFPSGRATDSVWGALVDLDWSDLSALDRFEPGYSRVTVGLLTGGGRMTSAQTYFAEVDVIDPGLEPFDWYLDLVVRGARARGLPDDYIDGLGAVSAIPGDEPEVQDC